MPNIFRWFDAERGYFPGLAQVIQNLYFEKAIRELIDEVLDENGQVRDNASELSKIRMDLYRKRQELRRVFDRIVSRLNKQGYLADYRRVLCPNGRRVYRFCRTKAHGQRVIACGK
ncbi:MAG: hypothetical protein U0T56_01155 [Ferruginibacter sp.]